MDFERCAITGLAPGLAGLIRAAGHFVQPGDCPFCVAGVLLRPDAGGRSRVASGRGRTRAAALKAALAEAAERASAIYRGDEQTRLAAAASLPAPDPRSLMLISDRQYRERAAWNRMVAADHKLPAPFDPGRKIAWIAGEGDASVTRYLPAAHCLLGYPSAMADGFSVPDSSGLAAGRTQDEAVIGGFLEVVERDAAAIWWYGRHRVPAVTLSPEIASLMEEFRCWLADRERQFRLLDLTNDFEVPVVAAVGFNSQGGDLSFGFAAAATVARAVESALGELVQFDISKALRTTAQEGRRLSRPDWLDWCGVARLADCRHLLPAEPRAANHIQGELTVERCRELCRQRGLELLTADLTRADIGVPVFRVVVPGLRPLWPRFAAGRLYAVPLDLGWRESPLLEQDLNPAPILY